MRRTSGTLLLVAALGLGACASDGDDGALTAADTAASTAVRSARARPQASGSSAFGAAARGSRSVTAMVA